MCDLREGKRESHHGTIKQLAALPGQQRENSQRLGVAPGTVCLPVLFRKAFHVEGNDDLRRVRLAQTLQVFQTGSQPGSGLP